MKIKNCIITKSDTEIVKNWKVTVNDIHSGIDLSATDVYSPFYGVVIDCVYSPQDKYSVIIQYNAYTCVRLCNITSLAVKRGSLVTEGQLVGKCNKFVHVEFLSYYKPDGLPPMSVRIENLSYYKVNPTELVLGKLNFPVIFDKRYKR